MGKNMTEIKIYTFPVRQRQFHCSNLVLLCAANSVEGAFSNGFFVCGLPSARCTVNKPICTRKIRMGSVMCPHQLAQTKKQPTVLSDSPFSCLEWDMFIGRISESAEGKSCPTTNYKHLRTTVNVYGHIISIFCEDLCLP